MGRKGAASPAISAARGSPSRRLSLLLGSWSARRSALAVAVLVLLGVGGFALTRELALPGRAATSPSPAAKPTRPAFSAAEEAYIQALWPIHGQVERSAARMALGQIFYKINELDRPSLKKRVDDALPHLPPVGGATPRADTARERSSATTRSTSPRSSCSSGPPSNCSGCSRTAGRTTCWPPTRSARRRPTRSARSGASSGRTSLRPTSRASARGWSRAHGGRHIDERGDVTADTWW